MDEIKRLVHTSKASGETVNTNKDITDKKIIEETMKAMDNDSINKKIIETKEDIIEDAKPSIDKDTKASIDKDTKPIIDRDTKPSIDKDTKPSIEINKKHC